MRHKLALGLLAAVLLPSGYVFAKRMVHHFNDVAPTFALAGRPLGGARPQPAIAAHLTGARIMAVGEGALVIDADSGALVQTDRAGKRVAQVAIGHDAGLLTYDPIARIAFVADRRGDRVAVVSVKTKLEIIRTIRTPAEPYGIALTPDRKTVLVSMIADRTLVAYDASTGSERWRTALGREPRGLAISPDGTRALVSYLTTGTLDQIDLVETRRAEHIALAAPQTAGTPRCRHCPSEAGAVFARASFTVTFLGSQQAVVPFQREVPVQQRGGNERAGSYGGGFESPVSQHLAFVGFGRETPTQVTAAISQHQPRAMAWDGARDALYIVGLGSDSILQIKHASQVGITAGLTASLTTKQQRCGPDGVAVTGSGNVLVWCSFTRSVQRVDFVDGKGALATTSKLHAGPELVASRLGEQQHQGLVLFHSADPATSQRGAMACSTCHPDNRTDGLSWRIDKQELQTPILAGRVTGTHPFKWDGGDKDLATSLSMTTKRLGGFGITDGQTAALAAYVESLPTVRAPTRDPQVVARGKQLFDSAEVGCRSCHDGPAYTDQERHKFTGSLPESDTPSLLGLAASAPYFHDGSAATLEALLRDRGAVHGMGDASKLSNRQVADLIAFLETL